MYATYSTKKFLQFEIFSFLVSSETFDYYYYCRYSLLPLFEFYDPPSPIWLCYSLFFKGPSLYIKRINIFNFLIFIIIIHITPTIWVLQATIFISVLSEANFVSFFPVTIFYEWRWGFFSSFFFFSLNECQGV